MEETFQSLTAGKVQELLVLCEIGDCNDEPIKQHILGISDFVREMRLQVGITDLPPPLTPRASPNAEATRGSYQFLPTPEKRSRADYKGLDVPSHKKKKGNKAQAKDEATTKDMAQEVNNAVTIRKEDIPAEPPSTTEANAAMNIPRAGMSLTDMYTYRGGKAPHSIVENILVNCIKLNDPLGRYGHRSKQATMTTKVEEIQSFVDDIVKLQYPDAVQLIKQENAFSASKSIQSRFNETVYWEIIKKAPSSLHTHTQFINARRLSRKGNYRGSTIHVIIYTELCLLRAHA